MLPFLEIELRIATLRNSAAAVVEEVQTLALATMEHAQQSGDTTLASHLFDAMGKGLSRAALAAYLTGYFPVKVEPARKTTKAGDTFQVNGKAYAVYVAKGWDKPETVWDFATARAVKWYDAKAESAVTPFDPVKLLASFVKRAIKASEEGTLKATWSDSDTKLVKSVGKLLGQDVTLATIGTSAAEEGNPA